MEVREETSESSLTTNLLLPEKHARYLRVWFRAHLRIVTRAIFQLGDGFRQGTDVLHAPDMGGFR